EGTAADATLPSVRARAVKLRWELWDGVSWIELGTSESGRETKADAHDFQDTTRAFTRTGDVRFRVPCMPGPAVIAGQTNLWVRVRIVSGDYGVETHYEKGPGGAPVVVPANFAPPIVHSAAVDYDLRTSRPATMVAYNDFTFVPVRSLPTP